MSKPTGGPAFPVHPDVHNCSDVEVLSLVGMTLRDYFAANAPFTFDDCSLVLKTANIEHTMANIMEMQAKLRLMYADAMLAERSK